MCMELARTQLRTITSVDALYPLNSIGYCDGSVSGLCNPIEGKVKGRPPRNRCSPLQAKPPISVWNLKTGEPYENDDT